MSDALIERLRKPGYDADADEAADEISALREERDRLRAALIAAVRAARLALFVIRKQDVMPNSSWQAGFDRDLKIAEDALAALGERSGERE